MRILFVGKENTIINEVSEEMFERVYKPKGWIAEGNVEVKPKEYEVETKPTDEAEIKHIERVKKVTPKQFNDKLIKGN